jgi:hypothetical protein
MPIFFTALNATFFSKLFDVLAKVFSHTVLPPYTLKV